MATKVKAPLPKENSVIAIRKKKLPVTVTGRDALITSYPHDSQWLLVFFSYPGCGACKSFKPMWANSVVDLFDTHKITFMEMDMAAPGSALVEWFEQQFDVWQYPMVLAFPPGSQLCRASAHEILLFRNNQPSFSSSLRALLDAHPQPPTGASMFEWCAALLSPPPKVATAKVLCKLSFCKQQEEAMRRHCERCSADK